jgi:hypothetical protein
MPADQNQLDVKPVGIWNLEIKDENLGMTE